MSRIEMIQYDTDEYSDKKEKNYRYKGEEVEVITVFIDSGVAIVEDRNKKIFEISMNELE